MVKFFRNLCLYWRYKQAFRKCGRLNAGRCNNRYIVISIDGQPCIINRPSYRYWRQCSHALRNMTWQDVYDKRVTEKIFE